MDEIKAHELQGKLGHFLLADLKKGLEKAEHNCRVWEQLATERRDACLAAEQQADKYRKWHDDQLAATKRAERERDALNVRVERLLDLLRGMEWRGMSRASSGIVLWACPCCHAIRGSGDHADYCDLANELKGGK
jgi:hypothetical protein